MWRNYLIIALRTLVHYRLFSFINIAGLSIGIACSILIGLYVLDELSFDDFHPDADRIYRVSRDFYGDEQNTEYLLAANAPKVRDLLLTDFPAVESAARLMGGQALLTRDDIAYYENNIQFADREVFDIFQFSWIAGSPENALGQPNTLVLTETAANKYFGNGTALNQTLLFENSYPLQVVGIIKDLPHNTHLRVDALVSMETLERTLGSDQLNNWGSTNYHTYIKLSPGENIDSMVRQFPDFLERHLRPGASNWSGMSAMAVSDIHLTSDRQMEMSEPGSMANVIIFTAVAFSILIIACFNFMNLATARSTVRIKEVGLRKTIGAERKHLIQQFLGESMVLALIATAIALALVELVLPVFNRFTGKPLAFELLGNVPIQLGVIAIVMFVGVFAGSYPALYLSSFKPVQVLKDNPVLKGAGKWFRQALVVMQFSVAITLIVATVVVLAQMNYARNIEMGFNKDQVVVMTGSPSLGLGPQWQVLRRELLNHPEITRVTASNITPLVENTNSLGTRGEGVDSVPNIPFMFVDFDFFETYGVNLVAGRSFSEDFPGDVMALPAGDSADTSGNVILNEKALELYGWTPQEAVGKSFEVFIAGGFSTKGRVVGVVADSNFESVRFAVKPIVFMLTESGIWNTFNFPTFNNASLRITGNDLQNTLAYIDAAWERFNPGFPVSRRFLDEQFNALYQQEEQQASLFGYFSILSIVIACLGLYGLASFTTLRRKKEIGVRKVLGSSVWRIVMLLTNEFSKLVLLANIIAWPVAYFAMNQWLANFAYRINLTPLIFIGSGLIALCIAWVTVGGTAARAASRRPVLALRYE